MHAEQKPQTNKTSKAHQLTHHVERDSLKDKMVVYAFILLTVGLLGYAAFEPYLKKTIEACRILSPHE
jgi:hypothetical protein